MSDYYKIVGTANRHSSWSSEVVLERDEEGNPSLTVDANGSSGPLNKEQREKVEALGFQVEQISKEEAEEAEQEQPGAGAGADVTGSGPVFGGSTSVDQQASRERGEKKTDNKTDK